jgi:hypothetical protein
MDGLEQLAKLAGGEIAPGADRDSFDADRADPDPAQPVDRDAHVLHQAAHDVVETLVDYDLEDEPFPGLAQDAELGRDHLLAVDLEAVADALEGRVRGASAGEDLVFLRQLVPGVHHPVGDIAVVSKEQQAFGIAVEATDRVDALGDVDKLHYRPALALVVDRGDKSGWFIEHDDPGPLGPKDLAIDSDLGGGRIDPGAELSYDFAIDLDTAGNDQRFRRPARPAAAGGHDPLQALHDASPWGVGWYNRGPGATRRSAWNVRPGPRLLGKGAARQPAWTRRRIARGPLPARVHRGRRGGGGRIGRHRWRPASRVPAHRA